VVPLEVVFRGHPHGYNFLFVDLQGPAERVSSFLWKRGKGAACGVVLRRGKHDELLPALDDCSR